MIFGAIACAYGVHDEQPIDYRLPEQVHLALGGKNKKNMFHLSIESLLPVTIVIIPDVLVTNLITKLY